MLIQKNWEIHEVLVQTTRTHGIFYVGSFISLFIFMNCSPSRYSALKPCSVLKKWIINVKAGSHINFYDKTFLWVLTYFYKLVYCVTLMHFGHLFYFNWKILSLLWVEFFFSTKFFLNRKFTHHAFTQISFNSLRILISNSSQCDNLKSNSRQWE